MIDISFGFDTYGKVKRVESTYVSTLYFMISGVPTWPRESYYSTSASQSRVIGVPFFFSHQSTERCGIPLARLDWYSVTMAYLRGICGGLCVAGAMGVFVAIAMWLSGGRADRFAQIAGGILVGCLAVGAIGGLLTYVLPSRVSLRTRQIRQACGQVLGVCADPAFIRHDLAQALVDMFAESDKLASADESAGDGSDLMAELVLTRARIAFEPESLLLERHTDELLERIQRRFQVNA